MFSSIPAPVSFLRMPDVIDYSQHGTREYILLPGYCKNCFEAGVTTKLAILLWCAGDKMARREP